ncbi:GAF domain-containing protein [Leptolyngbya ohadii]|uniref:GAF domain-containing protein n=1 Tax=Leptolyngbya ohadii TaxID=1962290 RepID=UPI000B5A18E2|nr:GAF domain-containing protein [Leptolyngbya ohadii]
MTIQPRPLSNGQFSPNEDNLEPIASESAELDSSSPAVNGKSQSFDAPRPDLGRSQQFVPPEMHSVQMNNWFANLPVRRKQMLALLTSEMIAVFGLVGVSSLLLIAGGRTQLANQAKAEAEVGALAYKSQIDHMGFGFRGQSDNPLVISAAQAWKEGQPLRGEQNEQLRRILGNEIAARKIDYATLVGADGRIIASANANRQGEKFDPQGLVSQVLSTPRQISASAIVSADELKKENPPLPAEIKEQDRLIRYVVTPVRDPERNTVIGALVSGDVVKQSIVERTIETLGNGYSAVYLRQPNGEFKLATSVDLGNATNLEAAQSNVPLSNPQILQQAADALQPRQISGEVVTDRIQVNGQTYTVAAKALPNPKGEPIAILVRGTSEAALNRLLWQILLLQLGIAAVAIAADVTLATVLGRSITRPIEALREVTRRFASGDRTARAKVESSDELGQLMQTFNSLADSVTASESLLKQQYSDQQNTTERVQLLNRIANKIRQSLQVDDILASPLDDVRTLLQADRVVMYRFNEEIASGRIVSESVGEGWIKSAGQVIYDPLTPGTIQRYKSGKISHMDNIDEAKLSRCHCEILERLEVKANLVAPILSGEELLGLLCVHQCSGPRQWQSADIELMQQVTTQIGYALTQAMLLKQQETTAHQEQLVNTIVSRMRQFITRQDIFEVVVWEMREALQADRVGVYLFDENWAGTFVAEAVLPEYPPAMGSRIHDPCFADKYVEKYRLGRVQATNDIYNAGLTACHIGQLEPFKVKANLVAPITIKNELIGLLIAHQCSGPREWQEAEIGLCRKVANQIGFAVEQADLFTQQQDTAQQEQLVNAIVSRMRQFISRQEIFDAVCHDMREALRTDRVGVYLFDENWAGTFMAESVVKGYPSVMNTRIVDPCFADKYVEKYRLGRVHATNDIYNAGLTACHIGQLEPFKVRANLIAPIAIKNELIGLLIAHQCDEPRRWQDSEIGLMRKISKELGFAIEQADLFLEREAARLAAEALSEEQRQQKEALQLQLIELLSEVEGAARGNLTVRANVTAGEIGTVADFFNSIVENLRQIVTKVKQSVEQVNSSLGENEGAIRRLAEEALKQADETTQIINSVEQMTDSIRQVATSARQAAEVARTASTTAETSGSAMDLTVQNILSLRETIGETAKKVKRLGESSQQISKVVSLINQIALQTNLLAINAGIEAARAGEEGQGFAVVAEEVGELAARSANATQEIEKIVATIQRETSQVVEAMEQSTAQVVEGTHLVENAKHSLGQILQVSREIDNLVQSISEATVSQVETSSAVARLIQQVAQVSEQTSKSSLQVSDAIRETVTIAQELQASVGTFEVE